MKIVTPYDGYKKSDTWKILKKSLRELIKNKDLNLLTPEEYIIGYLCKTLEDSDRTTSKSRNK